MDTNTINAILKTMPKGFRFHPTDEELLCHYLKLKIDGCDSQVQNVIAEVDICKYDPWDLPSKSAVKSDVQEWFFFSPCIHKYEKSSRFKRTTDRGYWKLTGKDCKLKAKGKAIGVKKHLGYYVGKFPNGERTNWVIHEYHSLKTYPNQKAFVLCRLRKNPTEILDKGSSVGNIASSSGNLEAETATPEGPHQLEEELRALIRPESPPQGDLMPFFLQSLEQNHQELPTMELQCDVGIIGGYKESENLSDNRGDEEDITGYLDPDVFERGEISEVNLRKHNRDLDLYLFEEPAYAGKDSSIFWMEGNPSAHTHDYVSERHENFLSITENVDSSSDDSYTVTPHITDPILQAREAVDVVSHVRPIEKAQAQNVPSKAQLQSAPFVSNTNIRTNQILAGKLESRSSNSAGSELWASFIVFDTPLLRQEYNPPSVYFLNFVVGIILFILILRDMVLYG